MKPISNSKLMNKLITNKLIQDSSAIYPTLIQLLCFVHLVIQSFISIDGSVEASHLISTLMVLSAVMLNFLSTIVFYLLSASMALTIIIFDIRLFYLYQTIPQDLLATPKFCWIIQLAIGYLDFFICIELAEFLTTLCKFSFKL